MLTYEEEQEIVATCQAMQELGFGLIRAMVGEVVTDCLVSACRPNPSCGGVPGYFRLIANCLQMAWVRG